MMRAWQSESPLMDRKVVGVVLFGVVAMAAVVTSQLRDVVWCSAIVVVVVIVVVSSVVVIDVVVM